jgi:hypothetical protein
VLSQVRLARREAVYDIFTRACEGRSCLRVRECGSFPALARTVGVVGLSLASVQHAQVPKQGKNSAIGSVVGTNDGSTPDDARAPVAWAVATQRLHVTRDGDFRNRRLSSSLLCRSLV